MNSEDNPSGPDGQERLDDAESMLEQLRASLEVLKRIAIDPDIVPPLEKQVVACTHLFVALPLPQQPTFNMSMSVLEETLEETAEALLEADLRIPNGTFRRKLEPETLDPYQLAAYARSMATAPFKGGDRQQRFQFAVTHALCTRDEDHRLTLRPTAERERLLDFIVEDMPSEPVKRAEIEMFLGEARGKLERFSDTEELFQANFDREVQSFRNSLGSQLFDPEILDELVQFEIDYSARTLSLPASSHPMSLPPPPPSMPSERPEAPAELDEATDAADRVAGIEDVFLMLRDIGVKADRIELIEKAHKMCAEHLEKLGEVGSEGFESRLEKLEGALKVGESTAHQVDALISMGDFRSWYERKPRPSKTLQRYARLLARMRLADEQKDRFEFVITRQLSNKTDRGRLQMLSRSAAAPILEYVLTVPVKIAPYERSGAVMFFRDATLQLSTLHALDDVFSGGFYLDVRGYKVALREQLLDPDVLYAAVALNVAIHNRIEEMRELEARSRNSLHNMLGKEDAEVRKAFGKAPALGEDQRFEETRRYLEKYRKNVADKPPTLRARLKNQNVKRAILMLGILLAGVLALKLTFRDINELPPMSERELSQLSPLLEAGGISEGESEPAFIGSVSSERWMLLSPEEREEAAERISSALRSRHVHAAFITREGHQAIQIVGGDVVSIE